MSFGISKRSLPCSLMFHSLLPIAAPQLPRFRRYDAASLGPHRGPLVAFFNTPTREPACGCRTGFGKFSLVAIAFRDAATVGDAGEVPIRAASPIRVIPAFGYLLHCEAVDLPSPAGDTNDLLRLSSFWPPIRTPSTSQTSRSCPLR